MVDHQAYFSRKIFIDGFNLQAICDWNKRSGALSNGSG